MGLTVWLVVSGVLVFAGASFFFALAESALFALGKFRAGQMSEQPGGALVNQLMKQPSELLATIVLGNTVANGALVTLALWPALGGMWPAWWSLLGAAVLILVGCEVLPKTLAVRAPERWAVRVARPMRLLQGTTGGLERLFRQFNEWLIGLLVRFLGLKPNTGQTDEEYQELVEMAYQQGTLAQSEKEIILQIISLDRKTARDVMKPRSLMAAISNELSLEEMREAARKFKHRHLPMYDETPDNIISVLNTRALLLNPQTTLEEATDIASFVPESLNLLKLLKSLQRQQRGLAIVLDEYGGTAGVVTLEDILEEIVGEIRDEAEPAGFVMEKLGSGRWLVNGTMRLDDFRREYAELGEVEGVETMGGLLLTQMEVVPAEGEWAVFRGLKLTARAVDERRVHELLVESLRKR